MHPPLEACRLAQCLLQPRPPIRRGHERPSRPPTGTFFSSPMRARDNPFSTARLHQIRYRFHDFGWEQLLERLERMNYQGAIVGAEGTGKTTLLEDLEPKLRDLGFSPMRLRLSQEAPRFSPVMQQMLDFRISARHILLFDGSEQLGWMAWNSFRWRHREAGGLIITRQRAGRLPTVFKCTTSPQLLAEIVGELLEDPASVDLTLTQKLFRRHRGNLRGALRDLYDRFALGRITPPGPSQQWQP
jgi:hypothetical protein